MRRQELDAGRIAASAGKEGRAPETKGRKEKGIASDLRDESLGIRVEKGWAARSVDSMKYLQVKNWSKHQHYKDRGRPSWIKFYTALLNPATEPKYAALSDGAKLTLLHCWLLAAETGNRIPEAWINRDRLNMQTKPKPQELIAAGFLSIADVADASSGSSIGTETHSPSVSVSPSSSTLDLAAEFEKLWAAYPRRVGRKEAARHFSASVATDDDLSAVWRALENYKAKTAKTEERFIQHGATWFNNWRDWATDPGVRPRAVLTEEQISERVEWTLDTLAMFEFAGQDPSLPGSNFNEMRDEKIDELVGDQPGETRWEKWVSFCERRGVSPQRKSA